MGETIEAVSGVSYSEYMNKKIYLPLHMEHTAATLEQGSECFEEDSNCRGRSAFESDIGI
ncbi:hypothetical protein AALD22_06425 [Lachnospiraceae bacterium 56-18]